jgi:hypothetical protein
LPFQPIPFATVIFGGVGQPPLPAANQLFSSRWPLAIVDPPRPGARFELSTFYVPVCVSVFGGGTPPTVCELTPQVFLSGILTFQADLQMNLVSYPAPYTGWLFGNSAANVSVNNPVPFDAGQTLAVGFQGRLDGDVTVMLIALAGSIDNPTAGGVVSPLAGSIGYNATPVSTVAGQLPG